MCLLKKAYTIDYCRLTDIIHNVKSDCYKTK